MRTSARLVMIALLCLAAVAAVSAQQKFQVLGPNECLNCHDHDAERQWYEKKEIPEVQKLFPDKGANAGHINSLKQLEAPKSNDFAKAIGLADKYDVKGACVQCHATVFAGDANAGVSCESCHGPASGYLKPHQAKGAYDQSVAQYGMTKLVGNLQGWTQQCTNCHIMDDERLIKAGHPSGDEFDLGKKFQPVSLHFKKMYSATDIGAVAKSEMDGIIRRRRPNAAPPAAASAPAAATPAAPPPAEPASQPPSSAPVETSAPAAAPAPAPTVAAPAVVARVAPPANLAAPQAGSPTSIEPPPPLEATPAPAPAPAANTALPGPTPAVTTLPVQLNETSPLVWVLVGALVVVIAGGVVVWMRGKKS